MDRFVETSLLRQFQREVERQCQFGMIALQDMDEASANSDGKLFWYSVQGLLVAVESISRLLWPPNQGASREALRENLGVDDDSPLKPREFVERFLRYDESLEQWHESSEHRRFFDSYTEPLDVLAETPPEDRFRGYQLEKSTLLFHGETYEIAPISEALEELQRRAEEEMQKPRFDHDI
ncbi:MAG TPA: hypothetical protein VF068_09200 [Rubrobacter sp.]